MMLTKTLQLCLLFCCICHTFHRGSAAETNQTGTDVTNEGPTKAERAYKVFSITLSDDADDSIFAPITSKNVIFGDGHVESAWEPNTTWSDTQFHHGSYVDRITFDFYYGAFTEYMIRKPVPSSSAKNVAEPQIIDFQMDDDESSGSFTVIYDCKKRSESTELNTTILIDMSIASGMSVKFGFRKTCGGGVNKHLDIGYYALGERGDEAESMGQRMMFPQPKLVVGPHVTSTRIFLLLNRPAESQEFFRVAATTGGKDKADAGLAVNVQGPVFGGVLHKNRPTILYVMYECKQDGKHQITLTIPLRPFNDLTATWEKDCGGGIAQGLNVGSEAGQNDIVKNGVTHANWLLGLSASSGRIGTEAPVVNMSTRFQDLWISNKGPMALHVAPEVVTVEKPELLWVRTKRGGDGAVLNAEGEDGGLLGVDGEVRLRLRMVCKKKGRSLVVVTLPVKSFHNIELGFIKECRAPRQFHHPSFLRTANSSTIALSLFLFSAMVMCWRLTPGHSDQKVRASGNNGSAADLPTRDPFVGESSRRSGRTATMGGPSNYALRGQEKMGLMSVVGKDIDA